MPPSAETARTVAPQITAAIATQTAPGRIELRLDPPELGRIEIGLDITDDGLRASVSAERAATGDLLRRHADMLLRHLAEAGFTDIDLSFGHTGRGDGDGSGREGGGSPQGAGTNGPEAVAHAPAQRAAFGSNGLDLRF